MAEALFSAVGLSIGYAKPLLSDLTFSMGRGEFWGVFGPNGAGKTTLIKTLLGVQRPLAGVLSRAEGLRLGYVPQLTSVRDTMPLCVRQVVELGALDLKGLPPVSEALSRVGLKDLEKDPFSALSGGQRQRIMVARALHRRPDVLVLDEPTNGVDLVTRKTLRLLMRELNGEGVTLLLITHLLNEIGPEVGHFLWLDSREGLFLAGERGEVLADVRLRQTYGAGLRTVDVVGETVLAWTNEREAGHAS